MDTESFGLAAEHIHMAAVGAALLLAFWLPRLIFRKPSSAAPFLMLAGLIIFSFIPGMPEAVDPTTSPRIWEITSELVLIVVLFSTGLRIDEVAGYRRWMPTLRLLAITMPLTIAAVAFLGWGLAGMTAAGAVVLGAALAPTDPVLAGDVLVGPPLEGREHPVRYALTTEAGLNDGLAFPFIYLGLLLATDGAGYPARLGEWLLWDVGYRIAVGAIGGAMVGWILGKIMFSVLGWNTLAKSGPGVIALAGVLLCYGAVELAEGYGFIGAFVAGLVCRRAEERSEFHRRLHAFSESIEHALSAILLVLLGSALPGLWPALDWRHGLIGLGLILAIRPLAGRIALIGTSLRPKDKWAISFFGVRGIGSIYYLAYASGHVEFVNEKQLWALVAFTIFASTIVHGVTARLIVRD